MEYRRGGAGLLRGEIEGDRASPGVYLCAGCGTAVFHTAFRFDAGDGWPAFFNAFQGVPPPPPPRRHRRHHRGPPLAVNLSSRPHAAPPRPPPRLSTPAGALRPLRLLEARPLPRVAGSPTPGPRVGP